MSTGRVDSVAAILSRDLLEMYFQPILSARQRTVIGVEALARARTAPGVVVAADVLFQMAAAEGLVEQLERRCCEKAVESFATLPRGAHEPLLFLNLGAWITMDDGGVGRLMGLVQASGLSSRQVAIEILEAKIDNTRKLSTIVQAFRRAGFLLVLDDVGAGHSNLDRIALLKPDILKIDRSLIASIDSDFHKQETLKSLVGLSRRIGALVVAEGLETEAEAMVALELGAELLQGYFVGRPKSAATVFAEVHPQDVVSIDALARNFKAYMVKKINRRKLRHWRFNIVLNEMLCHLANSEVGQFGEALNKTIANYPSVECIYVLDSGGAQITETICNPNVLHPRSGRVFRPAPKGTDHSLKEYYYILVNVELQKYTSEPYISFASGNLTQTISTYFRDARNNTMYVLCIDVLADERGTVGTSQRS
ncbi:MAG: EAL domain-containing protein [Acidobacteriota bacterium]